MLECTGQPETPGRGSKKSFFSGTSSGWAYTRMRRKKHTIVHLPWGCLEPWHPSEGNSCCQERREQGDHSTCCPGHAREQQEDLRGRRQPVLPSLAQPSPTQPAQPPLGARGQSWLLRGGTDTRHGRLSYGSEGRGFTCPILSALRIPPVLPPPLHPLSPACT